MKISRLCCVLMISLFASLNGNAQIIITIAGLGTGSICTGDGGPAINSVLKVPRNLVFDAAGNLFIVDEYCSTVRKVSTLGTIDNYVGNGSWGYSGDGGPATLAALNRSSDIAIDRTGNIYIADENNFCVRKVDASGLITTIAGTPGIRGYGGDSGPATSALLDACEGVAIDSIGNLYFTDNLNYRIRRVDTAGIITSIAGTGITGFSGEGVPAITSQIHRPTDIRLDKTGNIFFVDSNRVRKINTSGIIFTVAGNGVTGSSGDGGMATNAQLFPTALALDTSGNIYVGNDNKIRKVNTAGIITTIAGTGITGYSGDGGPATLAQLTYNDGLVIANNEDIYLTDNNLVRLITSHPLEVKNNKKSSQVVLSPNPCHNYFVFQVNYDVALNCDLIISDVVGKEIDRIPITTNESILHPIELLPGVYLVSVVINQERIIQKLIVQ